MFEQGFAAEDIAIRSHEQLIGLEIGEGSNRCSSGYIILSLPAKADERRILSIMKEDLYL